jgi:hypothetical protein
MRVHLQSSGRVIFLLTVLLPSAFGQSSRPKPLMLSFNNVDTNIKGDFGDVALQISSRIRLAFAGKGKFFGIVDASDTSGMSKQKQNEEEVDKANGVPVSPHRLKRHHSDANFSGTLKETPDGVVLELTIQELDLVLWQQQATHTKAQWQLIDIQNKDIARLVHDAAKTLWPDDPENAGPDPAVADSPAALTPEAIAKGIKIYTSGQVLTPKELAQSSYQNLADFLDSQRRAAQNRQDIYENIQRIREQNLQQLPQHTVAPVQAGADTGSVDRYHSSGLYRKVVNTLDSLKAQNVPVSRLTEMNENLKTLDDIQQLDNALKPYSDPGSQITYTKLADFIDTERRLQAKMQRGPQVMLQHPPPTFHPSTPLIDPDKQAMDMYHANHARIISNNLDQLRAKLPSKNIEIENLATLNNNANSVDDIQKLADGFKQLAESLHQ